MNNLDFILPEIFISLAIMFLLILGVFKKNSSNIIHYLSIVCLLITGILIINNPSLRIYDENQFDKSEWCIAMSNHQSWADIFIILAAGNFRIPLIKFFMKKELSWIPFIYLANKTLNMPFVSRHSKKEIEENPELRQIDYRNTLDACRRFKRSPSTVFSYAEGTRNNPLKYKAQNPPYKNLLNPKYRQTIANSIYKAIIKFRYSREQYLSEN